MLLARKVQEEKYQAAQKAAQKASEANVVVEEAEEAAHVAMVRVFRVLYIMGIYIRVSYMMIIKYLFQAMAEEAVTQDILGFEEMTAVNPKPLL